MNGRHILRWLLPGVLIAGIMLFRLVPAWAEWYAMTCYPGISAVLSVFSSWLPFSVGDCFIVLACLWLAGYPFYAWIKRKGVWFTIFKIIRFLAWIYIWFYLAWGMNYYRLPFYERTGIEKACYSPEDFQDFLSEYIVRLNDNCVCAGDSIAGWYLQSYPDDNTINSLPMAQLITDLYADIAPKFGLIEPSSPLYAKPMLSSRLMSRVAVTGYMGPFFAEFNLNRELLAVEYPFTYAHEMAHRLGIASEAEANLYAWLVTAKSEVPEIRFSGYFSLLGYVMGNARRLLPEEEYRQVFQRIRPEVIELYRRHLLYWREKYNPGMGKVQHQVYNAYLKGNKIDSGTKNYSEVVELLISLREVYPDIVQRKYGDDSFIREANVDTIFIE